ncbi:MAG: DNA/RNA nuclease SfsA [Oceanospirillaceae bacterium]|nr:DNA/RNA nuclease SfsA [Oceanospirillaceae bacterium]
MKYQPELIRGTLIRRYKRFLADIELEDGSEITAHCPNTGAMTACADPGSPVWLWDSQNPKRKYRHSWEWTTVQQRYRACVNTARANQLVAEALESRNLMGISGYQVVEREPRVEDGRLDFLLRVSSDESEETEESQAPLHYIEVKSVTLPLADQEGIAAFPDAVTARGLKHLLRLQALAAEGHQATLLFCVALEGIREVRPAWHIDPAYAEGLQQAVAAGVQVRAYGVAFSDNGMTLNGAEPLTVRIDPV